MKLYEVEQLSTDKPKTWKPCLLFPSFIWKVPVKGHSHFPPSWVLRSLYPTVTWSHQSTGKKNCHPQAALKFETSFLLTVLFTVTCLTRHTLYNFNCILYMWNLNCNPISTITQRKLWMHKCVLLLTISSLMLLTFQHSNTKSNTIRYRPG